MNGSKNQAHIDQFFYDLAKYQSTATVTNPYQKHYALHNLKLYLEYVFKREGKRVLLVGEAPGHRGCAITGIPFTRGKFLNDLSILYSRH